MFGDRSKLASGYDSNTKNPLPRAEQFRQVEKDICLPVVLRVSVM